MARNGVKREKFWVQMWQEVRSSVCLPVLCVCVCLSACVVCVSVCMCVAIVRVWVPISLCRVFPSLRRVFFFWSENSTIKRCAGCEKSGDVTTNFFFYISTECNVFIVLTQKNPHSVHVGQTCSRQEKLLVRVTAFLTAKIPSWGDFRALIMVRGSLFSSASSVFQTAFGDHSPSWYVVHKWFKEFRFSKQCLKTVTVVANLWQLLSNKMWPGEVSDQRTPKNYWKWDEWQF